MGNFRKNFKNKYWKKMMAGFFAVIMVLQAMSGAMDIVAKERGKVTLADTKGKYYEKNINDSDLSRNEVILNSEQENIMKEPILDIKNEKYDSNLEVKEKRTESSKTYKLADGSYVQETFFEPIHKKEGKEFVEIDNTLENTSKLRSNPIFENIDGLYTFKVEDNTATILNDKEQSFSIVNDSANLSTYTTKENVILYSEAYNNIDMEYRLHGNSVSTNFFVNGATTNKEIVFKIKKGDLKVKEEIDALTFLDEKEEVVYSYTKPIMYDTNNIAKAPNFSFEEHEEMVNVTISLETDWMNNTDRAYPVTMSTRAADESVKLSVESSYNRSLYPTTTSQYYDLFVGYENGMISGLGYPIGITRTYIHIDPISIGGNKKIVEASLNLTKKLSYANQWNTIQVGKTSGYVDPSAINWNNKPSVEPISTTDIGSSEGIKSLDVTSYITDIYKGVNNTIELKATNESASYLPNVFLGESSAADRPTITIKYRDDFDVDPNLPIDTFDTEMRIFSILNKGFEAFSFDGIAKPDSQMLFELVEKGDNKVIKTETSKGNVNKYFIDPIYITNYIADTQNYPKDKVNYTTDYIYKDNILEFDRPYEYIVRTKNGSNISTKEFRTDAFIKYKVKAGDNLKNIANYYGVTIDGIKIDNNLATNMIKEDDILLIRFKKDNDKVSSDIYTPPVRTIEYKAKYVDRGSNCVGGICPVIDPVNSTTGNYYYEGIDFTIKDAEDFHFTRYYNSTGPQFSNMFGNGFTTSLESYLSYDKKGNMLYFAGDGRIYEFEKDGTNFKAKQGDKIEVTKVGEIVVVKDLKTLTTYQFDVYGYLDQIISEEGIITKINYDVYGLITSIEVGERTITFLYNDKKLVKEVTLPSNKKVQYKYDDKRNLIEFTDANSNTKKYIYDKNNYLTSIVDKNNNVVTQNTYDGEGRVTEQIDGNGNISTLTYGDHKTTIKKGDGSVEEYTFNNNYDTLAITQDGKITSAYTYDSYRNITSMTDEDGNVTKYTYNKANLLKTEYSDGTYEEYRYDTLGNVIYEKERDGKVTNKTYTGSDLISTKDNQNNGIVYTYDDRRRVLSEVHQLGVSKSYTYTGNMIASITYENGLIENFEYDQDGNTLKESDNQGKITTYVYNANNQMAQKNYYDGTNEQWVYDGNGNIASYKDRIGGITNNTYDKNSNLLTSTKGNLKTMNTYNEVDQLISEVDEQGLKKSYTYDSYGNTQTETDAYGNIISYEYDSEGNVIKTTDAFGNEEIKEYKNGNVVKEISKEDLITTYKYDAMNREVEKANPNGTVESKKYDGLLLKSEKDGKGTTIEHFHDSFGREVKTTTTYGDGVILTMENVYDKYGNVVETKENGAITKNTYDVHGQLCSTTDALGNISSKEYDLDGNVIKETDALGNSVMTKYDGLQNVVSVTDKNGNIEMKSYNTTGQLISEADALGFIKTYIYNDKGQVTESKDAYNRKTEYRYDEYGNMIEVIREGKTIEKKKYDSHGREIYNETLEAITSSKYDGFDRVVEKTNELTGLTTFISFDQYGNTIEEKDSEGLFTTYEYDEYNRKLKVIDAYDREETYMYDIRDQIIKTKAFDGTITTSTFDEKGNVIESIDGLGKVTKNTYDAMYHLIKQEVGNKVTENVYDGNGQIIEVINHNNGTSTKKIYDKNGNTIKTMDALGNSSKIEYDANNQMISSTDAKGNISTKEYDAYGNIIKETNASGNTRQTKFNKYGLKEMEVDERGFVTTYRYNEDLLLVEVIDSRDYSTTWDYNDRKQKTKETNANGGVTEYEYDSYGREIKKINPNGKENVKEYDSLGNIIKEVDGKKTTINEYDTLGRITETKVNNVVQVKNKYNKFNQIIKSHDANKNVSTFKYNNENKVIYSNEKGFVSEKEYDVDGNIIKQIDNKKLITENTYDANNNLLQVKVNGNVETIKEYDANGNEIKVIENGAEIRKTFDQENRLIQVEVPSANKSGEFTVYQSVDYDETGNILKKTDANGYIEEKKYDANNNTIEEINKKGIKTSYEFDGLNNVVKVQNHKERYVSYTYDEANNVTFKNINNKYAEYTYDLEGNLIIEKNENGYTSNYSYDNFNRKTKQIKPDGSSTAYKYDNLGNMLSENSNIFTYDARGNVLTSTNKEGTVKNVYDAFNNKVETTDTNGKKVRNTFSDNNKLIQKEYAGIKVKYSYNEKGFLDKVLKDDKEISKYEYSERNEIVSKIQNNIITKKTYDDMGRILTQSTTKNNNTIENISYTYDANDNIVKEVIGGKENTYVYDGYDELIESHKYINGKKVDTTYKQDIFGNQISSSSNEGKKTYKYNEKGQIASINTDKGIIKYSYNDNGNVLKKVNENGRIDIYTYDDLNQLTKLEQGQFIYDYRYDAEKERIQQVRTDTNDYHYDEWYNYVEPLEVVGDKEIEDTFKNLKEQAKKKQDNGNVCTSVLSDSYDVTYFKEPEEINYTVDRSMEYSEVLQAEDTVNVYGDTLLQTDEVDIISGLNNSVIAKVDDTNIKKISYSDYGATKDITSGNGYNGETLDQTGLIYLRARYYDPSVSRFIQIDNKYSGEKEHVASQNKYVYTLSNPYKYVDKDGNKFTVCPPPPIIPLSPFAYLTMSDKDFIKWIQKKPIWERLPYIANRAIFQAKLKEEQGKPKPNNGSGQNNTAGNSGGSNQNKQKYKNKPIVECPQPKVSLLDILLNCVSWVPVIEEARGALDNGTMKFNGINAIYRNLKPSQIRNVQISISGARKYVKDLTGLSTGSKQYLVGALKKNIVFQVKQMPKTSKFSIFMIVLDLALDFANSLVDCIFGLITIVRAVAQVLSSVLYNVLRTAGSIILRSVLMPVIGPFAWLVTLLVDVGIDVINWFVNFKKIISDIVEWILNQRLNLIMNFLNALRKLY